MRTITTLLALLPTLAVASGIYEYRDPDGGVLFTDRDVMPEGYTLLDVRKGWSYEPRPLTPKIRDQYDLEIEYAARSHDLDPALIKSVIHAESHFERRAVSHAGAQGLMQLMPATARYLNVHNPFDARQNILGGSRFLAKLLDQFEELELALAAYNAGEGNVRRYGGIPPFPETQGYVKKVQELLPRYQRQFTDPQRQVSAIR